MKAWKINPMVKSNEKALNSELSTKRVFDVTLNDGKKKQHNHQPSWIVEPLKTPRSERQPAPSFFFWWQHEAIILDITLYMFLFKWF